MVDRFVFGKIVIDGQTHTRDLIFTRDRVWAGWWREQGHQLSISDLEDALGACPEALIVGTGVMGGMQVPAETRQEIERRGIALYILPTGKACDLYNELETSERKVMAALHLTC